MERMIAAITLDGVEYASYRILRMHSHGYGCAFYVWGKLDLEKRGTNGTGLKFYHTLEQAVAAGKRHLKRYGDCIRRF